jgi:Tfp pilus assembly protein PilX
MVKRDQQGFTLVEFLIATLVTMMVVAGAVSVTSQMQLTYNTQLDRAGARDEARFAADWIAREVRTAGANPYTITTSNCPAAGTAFLPIRLDPDGDGTDDDVRLNADSNPPNGLLGGNAGACTEANEDVTIAHDPGTRVVTRLDNNLGGAPEAMTDSVITQLQFIYLNAARAVTANPATIAFVQIVATAQGQRMDPEAEGFATHTVQSEVRLRAR